MPSKITIPVLDHNTPGVCTSRYLVRYKHAAESNYTRLNPDPVASPIVIPFAIDDVEYTVLVARQCCNGLASDEASITVNTTTIPS